MVFKNNEHKMVLLHKSIYKRYTVDIVLYGYKTIFSALALSTILVYRLEYS